MCVNKRLNHGKLIFMVRSMICGQCQPKSKMRVEVSKRSENRCEELWRIGNSVLKNRYLVCGHVAGSNPVDSVTNIFFINGNR